MFKQIGEKNLNKREGGDKTKMQQANTYDVGSILDVIR